MRKLFVVALAFWLVAGSAQAQTRVDIGYYNRGLGSFKTDPFTGADGFVDTGNIEAGYLSASDASGRSGNAIIVTPIADPVVRFNEYDMTNLTTNSYTSVTFHTPQYPDGHAFRSQLGFVEVSSPLGVRGRVHDDGPFVVAYSGFLGVYDGEDVNFVGSSVYSTLHFYQLDPLAGIPTLDPGERGIFDFYVAYPATQGTTSFYMDVVPSISNNGSDPNESGYRFNPNSNPGGGIVALGGGGSAPEPGTLALGALGVATLAGLGLRRRR
ncbi:PEP-CTERM sorting domain-containing protein [Armatimonas sp.]|uniref:PEP-CTERM sorting domain-containing protein n=1 Tax=Armatimonas sp. TaxID=1872638 RepID=UPI00286AEB9A|nr:PEP-CTERM sorting domain-containing protein [Armatimonas sp.]